MRQRTDTGPGWKTVRTAAVLYVFHSDGQRPLSARTQ